MSLHKRSCMVDSFSAVLCIPARTIAEAIGHPGLNGYHSQELIDYCLATGHTVTAIERRPVAMHPVTFETHPVTFDGGNDERFGRHMDGHNGVLQGRVSFSVKPHAVAWSDGQAWDPFIEQWYPILDDRGRPDDVFFKPLTFLRID